MSLNNTSSNYTTLEPEQNFAVSYQDPAPTTTEKDSFQAVHFPNFGINILKFDYQNLTSKYCLIKTLVSNFFFYSIWYLQSWA